MGRESEVSRMILKFLAWVIGWMVVPFTEICKTKRPGWVGMEMVKINLNLDMSGLRCL